MGTNCAPLVADLFLFCYERDFMMSLSDDKQADVIDAFNTTSSYLDDILNINNVYFDNMVSQIYPSELQLNKANASDTEAAFLDLHLKGSQQQGALVHFSLFRERHKKHNFCQLSKYVDFSCKNEQDTFEISEFMRFCRDLTA